MSTANKPANQSVDRALLRSSQILANTFHHQNQHGPNADLALFVNPQKTDLAQEVKIYHNIV